MRRRGFVAGVGALLLPGQASAGAPRLDRIRRRVTGELEETFAERGVEYPPRRVFLRAFKHERELELWAATHKDDAPTLIETHPFCAASGVLGPKRKAGDLQVPEGAYEINLYNPWSNYHLSMRVSYPNASDRVRGLRWNLGGLIMVHGSCASIGCIAIQDEPIERVFLTTYEGYRRGRKRPKIHIFPTRFDDEEAWDRLKKAAGKNTGLLDFWRELEPIHKAFEDTGLVPSVGIEKKTGRYFVRASMSKASAAVQVNPSAPNPSPVKGS